MVKNATQNRRINFNVEKQDARMAQDDTRGNNLLRRCQAEGLQHQHPQLSH